MRGITGLQQCANRRCTQGVKQKRNGFRFSGGRPSNGLGVDVGLLFEFSRAEFAIGRISEFSCAEVVFHHFCEFS